MASIRLVRVAAMGAARRLTIPVRRIQATRTGLSNRSPFDSKRGVSGHHSYFSWAPQLQASKPRQSYLNILESEYQKSTDRVTHLKNMYHMLKPYKDSPNELAKKMIELFKDAQYRTVFEELLGGDSGSIQKFIKLAEATENADDSHTGDLLKDMQETIQKTVQKWSNSCPIKKLNPDSGYTYSEKTQTEIRETERFLYDLKEEQIDCVRGILQKFPTYQLSPEERKQRDFETELRSADDPVSLINAHFKQNKESSVSRMVYYSGFESAAEALKFVLDPGCIYFTDSRAEAHTYSQEGGIVVAFTVESKQFIDSNGYGAAMFKSKGAARAAGVKILSAFPGIGKRTADSVNRTASYE